MNKEQLLARMQKPARILRTIFSILFVFAIVGTAILTVVQLAMPSIAQSMIELLDNPQVEQTAEVRESIAALSLFVNMPIHQTAILTLYTLLDGGAGILMLFFLKKLFASLSEERYSILRSEYASYVQKISITMLVSAGVNMIFPTVLALMQLESELLIEGTSDLLIPGLVLLAVASIYRHACQLQLLNEQEAYENARASEGTFYASAESESYREGEEAQKKAEEKSTFDGF